MKAVVFDFDGVVADSMPQHARAYRQVLAPLGVAVQEDRVFALEGARSESIIRQLLDDVGRRIEHDEIQRMADQKQRIFQRLGDPPVFEGARRMVQEAQRLTTTALVTGTRRENLERIIPDLLPGFDAVLSAGDYQRDKPDPEPYRNAARELGRDPAECIAVENAPRGVQSARRAGYAAVLAITTTVGARDLAEADEVLADHQRLLAALRARLEGA